LTSTPGVAVDAFVDGPDLGKLGFWQDSAPTTVQYRFLILKEPRGHEQETSVYVARHSFTGCKPRKPRICPVGLVFKRTCRRNSTARTTLSSGSIFIRVFITSKASGFMLKAGRALLCANTTPAQTDTVVPCLACAKIANGQARSATEVAEVLIKPT
jgi:hypothetical protein